MIERNRKSQVSVELSKNRREDGSTRAHAATSERRTAIALNSPIVSGYDAMFA